MDMKNRLDPELAATLIAFDEITGGGFNLNDIAGTRTLLHKLHAAQAAELAPIEGVSCEILSAPAKDGSPDVPVRVYRPADAPGPLPALLWIHGGGYVLGSAKEDDIKAKHFALIARCVVVSVDYRLAPEFPFPAGIDDCYTALKWLSIHTDDLDIDPERIAIGGASAGAGLAAGLSLMVRDRKEINVMFVMLIYPMLDDLNVVPASDKYPDTFIWTRQDNHLGWKAYLGSLHGKSDISPYAAPFRAKDLTGLPPTYLPVGELDLFLNENIDYSRRLLKAGVATELHVYPGAYHGFEGLAPDADISKRFAKDRDNALIRAFWG